MPALSPLRTLGAALLLAAVGVGCDFTPALDIETPPYERGLVLRSILAADSVATVRISESWDPYEGRPIATYISRQQSVEAIVTLLRDGLPVEVLTLRPDSCEDYSQPPDPETGLAYMYACGPYAGTVPIEPGATYTVRAEREGWPTVEGTVTVPRRPTLDVVEETAEGDEDRRFRVRLGDPAGRGDRYGLTLYSFTTVGYGVICENDVCRDTTFEIRNPGFFPLSFDTNDPVILSSAAEVAGSGVSFASFSDDTFDGREKTFTVTPSDRYAQETRENSLRVQLAALSDDLYDAYRISYFSGGEDNPLAEPVNLPTNVTGGYGLLGAVTLAEVTFEPREL